MHPDDLLDAIRRESAAVAAVARQRMDAPVPSCPGWDVATLVNHLGRVQRWALAVVSTKATGPTPFPPRPEEVTAEWFDEGTRLLCDALAEVDPELAMWNFMDAKPATARYWYRRQACEVAIHRFDAEAAVDPSPAPIETELALAVCDELLDTVLPRMVSAASPTPVLGGSLHLHATDSEHGEWLIRQDADGVLTVGHGHEKGDGAVRATASDLALLLWGRRSTTDDGIEVLGDAAIAKRWTTDFKSP